MNMYAHMYIKSSAYFAFYYYYYDRYGCDCAVYFGFISHKTHEKMITPYANKESNINMLSKCCNHFVNNINK